MRRGEIFRLEWGDILYSDGLIAVRARLKKGKVRLGPMPPELAGEIRRQIVTIAYESLVWRQTTFRAFECVIERFVMGCCCLSVSMMLEV
jgi:integrase